jgi:outer membrane cobalamin receptor
MPSKGTMRKYVSGIVLAFLVLVVATSALALTRPQEDDKTARAEVVASSRRFDDPDNALRLGGYAILNLTAEWNLAHGWSVLVRGDNVLDRQYELAAHYATGGARVFAALRWQE